MPPDIDSPKTFGDYYWAAEVEAKRLRSEQREKSYGPIIGQWLRDTGFDEIMPDQFAKLFDTLRSPSEPDWDDVQRMFLGTVSRAVALAGGEQMAKPFEYEAAEKYQHTRIRPESAITLFQRKKITESLFDHRMHSGGYSDEEAEHLYNSMRPYPTMPELIRYGRYNSDAENPKAFVWELFDIHPDDWEMWNWLSIQKLSTQQVQTVYRRGGWDKSRSLLELSRLGWPLEEREALINLAYELPNAMLLVQGNLLQGVSQADMIDDIAKAGIHPTYAEKYFDGVLTKPNTQDLIAWQLRLDPTLGGLNDELRKTGVHPDYFDVYKTLAHPIPPINDLITMAVREAFTPDIAQRFGQYEGLPTAYVEAAEKKGLTKEWAERYWAAHWTLPSVQQGFAMLHRGIINQPDLSLLMRALDIMPFWRDKLMQLSYKPLTRVDVRRMHLLGTLDEAGVNRAYRDVGYNDLNAGLMTDFTVRYNRRSLAGFTQRDVVAAYINRFIESGQATSILRDIGTKADEIPNVMRLANLKREWKHKDETIVAIRNRYNKGTRNLSQTRSALSQLGFADDYVSTLLAQWEPKTEAERVATFTNAQTLKLFTMGLITEGRARQELQLLGFDTERRELLIRSVTEQTE
ncbi:hypothetical protein LCGC14_1095210 [marine sediment metagenome]|uniref:Uncharacterized protein n=1 Tax=marine sediment metagenome TaxID=412755 RepID=A0A0F9QH55_9ZZZZ